MENSSPVLALRYFPGENFPPNATADAIENGWISHSRSERDEPSRYKLSFKAGPAGYNREQASSSAAYVFQVTFDRCVVVS
ncbi:hypothetical protein P175DRAFT_0503166 [Aspergillus ochraceoroseus IBT 24754]|uniref:Uncharacterized protein n=1 Tax=Aspergillus ochraceoroseus IBT 24754 TaxID=1392256 RepID=A0A2T5LTL4_9EURO|nr:uncharacterized protein P175DRAFT_0503166 [Aspergillus ochraceoroseus IBT 24754]PTU19626.1 hypothetical protein P175DRAFT_0503166 [Aspergillus ochraceoroseus IBT 24754]